MPERNGYEIGVGTGRFAKSLGIKRGCEVSKSMGEIAKKRGIEVDFIEAEKLDFKEEFDFILMVTTICFVKNSKKVIKNCYNALKSGGYLLSAFVDKDSSFGKFYLKNKDKSKFYKDATFFSKDEIIILMKEAGFKDFECVENLYGDNLDSLRFEINSCNGGAFKVIRGKK
ncbi:class I SAM-dependent methyltransferase [Caminibacter mediatlanticus]|uniref:Methyltransferase type 11 domain-containing protein n=1 Tax=Caminibacter mediatlanticus TB-2 TaxID=391592 RepID=A0AAI9AH69_9BACT|nr:class I SAM-dependent methyltransferase [Caminibacter mediatlanticus]EDM23603.1 hypothetical protein CMTB2_04942 [Caminibacter mediatlanticus TB-2]